MPTNEALRNMRYAGFKRSLKKHLEECGLRSFKFKYDFLLCHPNTKLPRPEFTYQEHCAAYKAVIEEKEGGAI